MANDPDFRQELEAAKRRSTFQLLFKCSRLMNELGIERLRGFSRQPYLRAAHMALLPHIDLDGTRLTTIAARVGISKQAVGQLIAEMETMGMLERHPDPSDGRAKLIRFSNQGRRGLLEGLGVLGNLEVEFRKKIGDRAMDGLHAALTALLAHLEPQI